MADTITSMTAAPSTPVVGSQPRGQISGTETYSRAVLGPVFYELRNLRVAGTAGIPSFPDYVTPQSPYIVMEDEEFTLSVDVKFNNTPLTRLLLCLGIKIEAHFALEGVGAKAAELDLSESVISVKDEFNYTITWRGTPKYAKMTPGFYGIAGVVNIESADHPCGQYLLGCGYIAGVFMQVC
jgi:hypothetical protein